MSGSSRPLAWLLLLAWLVWAVALQAELARSPVVGPLGPDLSVALVASLAGFLAAADVARLALVAALARASLSVEPDLALLSGFLGLGAAAYALRDLVDLRGPFARAGLAAVAAPALAAWTAAARAARDGGGAALGAEPLALLALSTGVVALVAGGGLARLPGLTPLRRRTW